VVGYSCQPVCRYIGGQTLHSTGRPYVSIYPRDLLFHFIGVLIAVAGGVAFNFMGILIGWVLGALVATALWSNATKTQALGRQARGGMQLIVGCATASILTPAILAGMAQRRSEDRRCSF
jgi:hypothetical protein